MLEFEPAKYDVEERSHQLKYELAALVSLLDGVPTLSGVCNVAVRAVRKMSGYDRVMIYQFHGDMHGEVVAEEKSPELESWLGLHYPASAIPLPAREIFLLNKLRVIPDVDYVPVPIVGSGRATLDLGQSLPPPTDTAPDVMGCAYVIEGSMLGALVIYRHMHKCSGITSDKGAAFIYGYGERTSFQWKTFLRALDATAFSARQRDECIEAAAATFETMQAWFVERADAVNINACMSY